MAIALPCLGSVLCLILSDLAVATLDDASSMIQGRANVMQLEVASSNASTKLGVYARLQLAMDHPSLMGPPPVQQPKMQNPAMTMNPVPVAKPLVPLQPIKGLPAAAPMFNCQKRPHMCKEPFNCHHVSTPAEARERIRTMAKKGHSNFHTWCRNTPYWDTLVQHCLVEKDLVKGAWSMYYQARRGELGEYSDEMDASYCFMMGHCSNEAVTASTTPKEAEKMCDQRFGHRLWAHDFGYQNATNLQSLVPNSMGFSTSPEDKQSAIGYVVMSCAMGNFHCDVMYCKETYCKNKYYVDRYKHLQPRKPGHKLRQYL